MNTKRPTKFDSAIQEELADEFGAKANEWGGGSWIYARKAMRKVLAESKNYDGYRLAKKLDEVYAVDADEDLVRILSEIDFRSDEMVLARSIEWLPSSGLTAPEIGSKVQTPYGEGVVCGNLPHGSSAVQCGGAGLIVVAWEDLAQL